MEKIWTRAKVEQVLILAQDAISLNAVVRAGEDGDEVELGSFIEDPGPNPEELMIQADKREIISSILCKCLKPRDQEIIRMRFGFDTEQPMTLAEVGQQFGLTRERVRQIEQKAIRRLRCYFLKNNIKEENL